MSFLHWCYFRLFLLCLILLPVSLPADTIDTLELIRMSKSRNPAERLSALDALAKYYYRIDPAKSLSMTMKELDLATREKYLEYQNRATLRLGFIHMNHYTFDSALYYLNKTVEGTKKSGDHRRLARAYTHLGELFFKREERLESLKFYKLAIAADASDEAELTDVYNKLGIICGDAGNLPLSMEYFNRSLHFSERQKDSTQMGYTYANIAGIFDRIGNVEKCMEYNEKALSIFRMTNNIHGQGYIYNGMGITSSRVGDYHKALEYFRKALNIQTHEKDLQKVSFILTNMGDLFLQTGQPDSALHCYLSSLAYSEKSMDKLPLSCTYLSLGRYYFGCGQTAKALDYASRSLKLSEEINYRDNLEGIYQFLSEVYEENGQPKESLACLQKRNALRDSTLHVRAQNAVTEMMIKYETGEKKEEISKLNLEVNEKNEKIRNIVMVSLALFLISTLAFILIYYYYRKRLKPKVATMDLIMDKVSAMKESDSRRIKSLKKILPPQLGNTAGNRIKQVHVPDSLIDDIENLIKINKIYLDENLTLVDVAEKLNTNTSYLSRLINDHYHVNFSAFINRYRVEEAKELIRNNRQETLSFEGIARNAGFRSRSSFNQAFKSVTGMTPSQFASNGDL